MLLLTPSTNLSQMQDSQLNLEPITLVILVSATAVKVAQSAEGFGHVLQCYD